MLADAQPCRRFVHELKTVVCDGTTNSHQDQNHPHLAWKSRTLIKTQFSFKFSKQLVFMILDQDQSWLSRLCSLEKEKNLAAVVGLASAPFPVTVGAAKSRATPSTPSWFGRVCSSC